MNFKLKPIAVAIIIGTGGHAYAVGGDVGENGLSKEKNGNLIDLIGSVSVGATGTTGDGLAGHNIDKKNIIILNKYVTGLAATNGSNALLGSGGGGSGGHGGGSVIGGLSQGGAGGYNYDLGVQVNGGDGGAVTHNIIEVTDSTLIGGSGGAGGNAEIRATGGIGAMGQNGGSVFGGISQGGAGGDLDNTVNYFEDLQAKGGNGGNITQNRISLSGDTAISGSVFGGLSQAGAGGTVRSRQSISSSSNGGLGGDVFENEITLAGDNAQKAILGGRNSPPVSDVIGNFGISGPGAGSVFGGISQGGAGGAAESTDPNQSESTKYPAFAEGGAGGRVTYNTITVTNYTLEGRNGGVGHSNIIEPTVGGGAAGHGGGSIFGGLSQGGAGGFSSAGHHHSSWSLASSNGGDGGAVTHNSITVTSSTLTGGDGGVGADSLFAGGSGAGGYGGGSIFGGFSQGGAGGNTISFGITRSANGGDGGPVTHNTIVIRDSILMGGLGGTGGAATYGGLGAAGQNGGSVFGGVSQGGAGGGAGPLQANGGKGGDVRYNTINISGKTSISGDIYGGFSQGGDQGPSGAYGKGGLTSNNTITLVGDKINIGGSIYGGFSIDGNGEAPNSDILFQDFYKGNTLNSNYFQGNVKGIYNFENYNWKLTNDDFSGKTIYTITNGDGNYRVALDNTKHTVDVDDKGNVLNAGDIVVLINKAQGDPKLLNSHIEQGFFIVYDAEMKVEADQLVLKVLGVEDGQPDGKIHPESEAFLKGRVAQLAMVDQGADMISEGIWSARASLAKADANLFVVADGGSNRYKASSKGNVKLDDFKFAVGVAKAFKLQSESVGMLGVFAEHGNGNYKSHSDLGAYGEIDGEGKTRYNGVGLLFHMDVAGTDISKVQNKPNIFDSKYGLYLHGALRAGYAKVDFHSADLVNGDGVEGSYNTKSRYLTAMAGAGYVLTLNQQSALDFNARYTFSRLNGKNVQVVDERMNVGAAHSHRLHLGARYGYAYSDNVMPYVGVAYERNFNGDVSGSAYGFKIKEKSLKGNTGLVEAGLLIKPQGNSNLSVHMGLQGYLGQRQGVNAAINARYVF